MGLTSSWWAVLCVPTALLIGFAFAGAGLGATTYMRSFVDFDLVNLAIIPMFLFSGTFFPIERYPEGLQWVVRCSPLYQGVALERGFLFGVGRPLDGGAHRLPGGHGCDRSAGGQSSPEPPAAAMSAPGSRLASDDEVTTWQEDGWVLLEGLVGTDEIDAATAELGTTFPDAGGVPRRSRRREARVARSSSCSDPRSSSGRARPRLPTRAAPVAERVPIARLRGAQPAVRAPLDRRLRRAGAGDDRSAAATRRRSTPSTAGETNYEQPMHTDRNHSWLPARRRAPWWHIEGFLYLSDVHEGNAPTHLVPLAARSGAHDGATGHAQGRSGALRRRAGGERRRAVRSSRTAPTSSTAASTSPSPVAAASCSTSATRSPVRTGSGTTPRSRARPILAGRRSSRDRPRASWSCSGSLRPAIRSGTRSSSTRRRVLLPRLDLSPWRARADDAAPSQQTGLLGRGDGTRSTASGRSSPVAPAASVRPPPGSMVAEGARVAVVDRQRTGAEAVADEIGGSRVAANVVDPDAVDRRDRLGRRDARWPHRRVQQRRHRVDQAAARPTRRPRSTCSST